MAILQKKADWNEVELNSMQTDPRKGKGAGNLDAKEKWMLPRKRFKK